MSLRQQLRQALANILSAKLRSFLAILGIVVGTASVVALVSTGEMATARALKQFENLGLDLMAMNIYESNRGRKSSEDEGFNLAAAEQMYADLDHLKNIAPYTNMYAPLNFEGIQIKGNVVGVTDSLPKVIKIKLRAGRFVSFLDDYAPFCVIGDKIYQQIKRHVKGDVIGQQIKIAKNIFTIIGVAEPWGENNFFNANVNKCVMIPIGASPIVSQYAKINSVVMQVDPKMDPNMLSSEIKGYVDMFFPGMRTYIRSAAAIVAGKKEQQSTFTLLLGFIGSIALLVGGIGVMNVMLVSVAERKREIGIRMAIGAMRRDIRRLFLIEAIILTLFGGVVGVVGGIGASYLVALYSGWGFDIFLMPPLLGFIVSVATGIFFGFYPAHRASKLDPIESLRYE